MSAQQPPIPARDLERVLEPDMSPEFFIFGKNPDGSPRRWKFQPLTWKYEKYFRKQVMPLLQVTYKPFETVVTLLTQEVVTELSPSLTKALFESEVEADDYLTGALHAILMPQLTDQDKKIDVKWVEENADSREQLNTIIQRQCEIHKIMDRMGESLAERFVRIAKMAGVEVDLPTLKRLWKQVSESVSARITKLASTADSAIGHFTESSLETTSRTNQNGAAGEGDSLADLTTRAG